MGYTINKTVKYSIKAVSKLIMDTIRLEHCNRCMLQAFTSAKINDMESVGKYHIYKILNLGHALINYITSIILLL